MNKVSAQAYHFIKKNAITTLPVTQEELLEIAAKNNWRIYSYNQSVELRKELKAAGTDTEEYVKTKDGFAVIFGNQYIIFYRDSLSMDHKVFVLLHEFAHIVLKHTYHGIMGKSLDCTSTEIQEAEADTFAREVSAPLPVLYKCHFRSEREIERHDLLKGVYARDQYFDLVHLDSDYCFTDLENEMTKIFNSFIQSVKITRLRSAAKRYVPICVIAFIVGILLMVPFNQAQQKPAPVSNAVNTRAPATSLPITETVYVTRTGDKYHVDGCHYIKGKDNLLEMTAGEAEQAGYEPCSVCVR